MAVDDHDLAGAPEQRGVCGHETDRATTIHDDGFARLYGGELSRVVAGGEDVRQHDVVRFLLCGVFR